MLESSPTLYAASTDPALRSIWGCERLSQKLVKGQYVEYPCHRLAVNGVEYQFFRHPVYFLLPSMTTAVDEINYNKGVTGGYSSADSRKCAIMRFYDAAYESAATMKRALKNGK